MTRAEVIRAIRGSWLDQPCLKGETAVLVAIGCFFWMAASLQVNAFQHEVFGHFALQFPAEMWAGMMILGGLCAYNGLSHPRHKRLLVLGSVILAANFLGLAYSAIMTGGEPVIGLHASMLFAPRYTRMAWEAWNDAG